MPLVKTTRRPDSIALGGGPGPYPALRPARFITSTGSRRETWLQQSTVHCSCPMATFDARAEPGNCRNWDRFA